jgi:uncharacterized protein (TIGR02996 family)
VAAPSRWRALARTIIDAVLAGLPADASEAARRLAVSRAYPWGERSNHPYKAWLAEVRAVLGPDVHTRHNPRPVAYELTPAHWTTPFYVTVRCDWCRAKDGNCRGCLMCAGLTDPLTDLLANPEFVAFLRACRATPADPTPRLALADWLDERNHHLLADVFRASTESGVPA